MPAISARRRLSPEQQSILEEVLEEHRQLRLDLIVEYSKQELTDRAVAVADREISEIIVYGAKSVLADINSALARMRAGTYGRCVRCATVLPVEWLEELPQLARCFDCERATR